MRTATSKWILYNLIVCFSVYWLSNLILWYPWSINEKLGQMLMLTVNPVLWGYASYVCIVTYPKQSILNGVLLNSLVFVIEAIVSDFIFFVVIRDAADKLFHVTTFYAWGFVLFVPFIVYILFKKAITKNKSVLQNSHFQKPAIIGIISFAAISVILLFNINFT